MQFPFILINNVPREARSRAIYYTPKGHPKRRRQKWTGDRNQCRPCLVQLFVCNAMTVVGVRRAKAALSSGCKPHPATAPAGSNRSSYGGDEIAEAFGMRVTNW